MLSESPPLQACTVLGFLPNPGCFHNRRLGHDNIQMRPALRPGAAHPAPTLRLEIHVSHSEGSKSSCPKVARREPTWRHWCPLRSRARFPADLFAQLSSLPCLFLIKFYPTFLPGKRHCASIENLERKTKPPFLFLPPFFILTRKIPALPSSFLLFARMPCATIKEKVFSFFFLLRKRIFLFKKNT